MQLPDRTALPPAGAIRTYITQALILAVTMAAAGAGAAFAAEPAVLTTLHAVRSLTKAEAQRGLPVAFEATVTYYNKSDVDLFVQEGSDAIYVETSRNQDLTPGDRVQVRGRTRSSFTTDVLSDGLTMLHHGVLPQSVAADFEQLIRAELDCMRVSVHATVRSADTVTFGDMHGIYLKLLMDGGPIDATVVDADTNRLKELLDADVEVTGVVSGKFDSKMQLIGILLEVPSLANVKILKRAEKSPDALPITPMHSILSGINVHDLSRRVRVRGTITYCQPGSAVVLQNGTESL